MAIRFYKEFGELGYLATYSNHGFIKDGIYYQTSEHYYQSKKFKNKAVVKKIIKAKTPKEASEIGRDRNNKLRPNWKLIKNDVMYEAVLYKFLTHKDIQEKLLATGDEEIIEETVKENYWGCGPLHDGQNNYGKIMSLVRENIRRMNMGKYYLTKEGYQKMWDEYQSIDDLYIETTKAMGKSDEMDSDLRENPEFMELRVKAMYEIPKKKAELFNQLNNAIIIEETDEYKNWDKNTVIPKCVIKIEMNGMEEEFTILGSNESNLDLNIISCEAPLAQKLMGRKSGETINFNGMKVKIKEISEVKEDAKERTHR